MKDRTNNDYVVKYVSNKETTNTLVSFHSLILLNYIIKSNF